MPNEIVNLIAKYFEITFSFSFIVKLICKLMISRTKNEYYFMTLLIFKHDLWFRSLFFSYKFIQKHVVKTTHQTTHN